MTQAAYILAVVCALLGVRSAIYWARHRMETEDTTDEVLFALFVTGRVGTWLLAAGMFLVFGSIEIVDRASQEEARNLAWLAMVFLALGAVQLLAAWFLANRGAARLRDDTEEDEVPPPPDRS